MRFQGKVALVTGAASGIGAATAELLRAEGAAVVALDIAEAEGVQRCDVTDADQVRAAVDGAVREHGGLDLVANVAGMVRFSPVDELPLELWHRHLDLNLTAPFVVSQAALPSLRERTGSIVNVASVAGVRGQAYTAAYCASKGGVVMLTRSMAVELAKTGVRVNCVCPGGVLTPLVMGVAASLPEDRDPDLMARMDATMPGLSEPSEVAEAIAYLGSDAARSVTGTALMLDRGATA